MTKAASAFFCGGDLCSAVTRKRRQKEQITEWPATGNLSRDNVTSRDEKTAVMFLAKFAISKMVKSPKLYV